MCSAQRRQPFRGIGPCQCEVCRECEQLHDVALWNLEPGARMVAMTLIAAIDAAHKGRLGAFKIEQLFD